MRNGKEGASAVSPALLNEEAHSVACSSAMTTPDTSFHLAILRSVESEPLDLTTATLPGLGALTESALPTYGTPQEGQLSGWASQLFTPQSASLSFEQPPPSSANRASPVSVSFQSFAQQPAEPVFLSADHVALSTQHRRCQRCEGYETVELSDLSVSIPYGTFHCVLATTAETARCVLELLAGVRMPSSGTVLGNDVPTCTRLYRRRVGWISDVSGITASLTVQENLRFAYRMRVAASEASEAAVLARVAEALGLDKVLNEPAGALNRAHAYLLSVGLELVLEPAVLVLDSPLLHFSPTEMTTLFLIAIEKLLDGALSHPITVILSASDISWPLYNALDGLTVLAVEQGETIFSGAVAQLEPFLHTDAGIPYAQGESIADLLAQMEDSRSTAHVALCYRQCSVYRDVLEQVDAHRRRAVEVGMDLVRAPRAASIPRPAAADTDNAMSVIVVDTDGGTSASSSASISAAVRPAGSPVSSGAMPLYGTQFGLLLLYMVRKNVKLSVWYMVPWVALFAVFVVISAITIRFQFGEALSHEVVVQNYFGVVFMILACACQTGLAFIDVELEERLAFRHFERNHYLRNGQYLLATCLRLIIVSLVMALVGLFCALVLGLPVWPLTVLMGLLFLAQSALTLTLVYASGGRRRLVVLIQGGYYLYSTLFSGYLINTRALPVFIQSLSMLRYAYIGVLVANVEERCRQPVVDGTVCLYATKTMSRFGFTSSSSGEMALLLFGLALGFLGLAALLMQINVVRVTRER